MRNPLKRTPSTESKPTLRERAASLKASAARVMRHQSTEQEPALTLPSGSLGDQGNSDFPIRDALTDHSSREIPGTSSRDDVAAGVSPMESAMGRHETFENAAPLAESLLSSASLEAIRVRGLPEVTPGAPAEAVATMIRSEGKRLLDIADAEFDRLYAEQTAGMDDDRCDAIAERLNAELRLRALDIVADENDPAPPVDWYSPPAGLMAHPAIHPQGFIKIRHGLKVEAERLHGIALAEFERRRGDYSLVPFRTEGAWSAHLRRELLLDELADAASPERAEPAGNDRSEPGFVLYEDAAGATHRKPVADWIGFMAQRLYGVAREELTRGVNAVCNDLTQEECGRVEAKLRRDLRIDALHDLAYQFREIAEASREYAVGARWRLIGDAAATAPEHNDTLVRDIIAGWRAWAEAEREGEGLDADTEAEKRARLRRDDLIDAAHRLPATMAALPAKALALAWIEFVDLWRMGWARDEYQIDGRLALDIHATAVSAGADVANPDVDLLALESEFVSAHRAVVDTAAAHDAVWNEYADPKVPLALKVWRNDWVYSVIPRTKAQTIEVAEGKLVHVLHYGADEVARLRSVRCIQQGYGTVGELQPDGSRIVPDAMAQERVDAIVAAWDQWQADIVAAKEALGLPTLIATYSAAKARRAPILERLRAMPARSLAGLGVKARVAFALNGDTDPSETSLEDHGPSEPEAFIFNVAGDVLALTRDDTASHPDAALIALGLELNASEARENAGDAAMQAAENDAAWEDANTRIEAACAETGAILERLAAMPAHTAEGLRVKLRAIRHGAVDASDAATTCRVFRSLLLDAGVPEAEIGTEA